MRLGKAARAAGFSLVEIAIVLVVVGLIVSGGLLGVSPVLQANKVTQTNAQMDKIEQALQVYVNLYGCLPCPADPATLTGQAHGSSDYNHDCQNSACSPTHGIVPWVNLGLARQDVIDPFGSFIDYVPATGLNLTNTTMYRTPTGYPSITGWQIQNASGVAQTNTAVGPTNGAAYVLISHGPDGSGGYTAANGTLRADPNNSALQSCNTTGQAGCGAPITGNAFVQDTPKSRTFVNGYFDDIIRFRTAPVIIQSCGSTNCGNPG